MARIDQDVASSGCACAHGAFMCLHVFFVRACRVHMFVQMGGCRLVAQVRHGVIARSGGSWHGPDARVSQMTAGWDKGKHGWDARCGWA